MAVALARAQDALFGYIYTRLGDLAASEDVLQETDRSIWSNLSHLDSPDHFLPWAKTLAAYEIKHYLTKRARERKRIIFDDATVELLSETTAAPDGRESLEREVTFDALEKCLEKLPPDLRDLLDRRYWHDEPIERLAREDDSNRSAVTVRLVRVRRRLADCVRKLLCSLGIMDEPASPHERDSSTLLEAAFGGDETRRGEINRRLREDAAFREDWIELSAIHAALAQHAERFHLLFHCPAAVPARPRVPDWAIAAGLAVCVAGIAYAACLLFTPPDVPVKLPASNPAVPAGTVKVPQAPVLLSVLSEPTNAVVAIQPAEAAGTAEADDGPAMQTQEEKTMNTKATAAAAAVSLAVGAAIAPAPVAATEPLPGIEQTATSCKARSEEGFVDGRECAQEASAGRRTWVLDTKTAIGTVYSFH